MALIKCPECGSEISSNAKRCPHCGGKTEYAIKNRNKWLSNFLIITILLVLVFIGIGMYKAKQEELKQWEIRTFGDTVDNIIESYSNQTDQVRKNLEQYRKELEKFD